MDSETDLVGRKRPLGDRQVVLHQENLRGADFSRSKLDRLVTFNSRLQACRFDGSEIGQAVMGAGPGQSEYIDCTFNNTSITFGPAGDVRFVRCRFHDADLRDWFCFAVELVDCSFTGTLRRAYFNGVVDAIHGRTVERQRNEFHGNDFSGMELVDVAFRTGIDLTRQRLPSGADYLYLPNAARTITLSRAAVVKWEDVDLRERALTFLKSLEGELEGGQVQHLLRPMDYYGYSAIKRDMLDAVFKILRSNN